MLVGAAESSARRTAISGGGGAAEYAYTARGRSGNERPYRELYCDIRFHAAIRGKADMASLRIYEYTA